MNINVAIEHLDPGGSDPLISRYWIVIPEPLNSRSSALVSGQRHFNEQKAVDEAEALALKHPKTLFIVSQVRVKVKFIRR